MAAIVTVPFLATRGLAMVDPGGASVETVVLPPPVPSSSRSAYAEWLGPAARDVQRLTGIPASVLVGMSMYETDGGRSWLAQEARNLYGMTATGGGAGNPWWDGERAWRSDRHWRVYRSPRESLLDAAGLFYRVSAYAPALAYRSDPDAFLARIVPVYAPASDGNPGYYAAVLNLIEAHGLRRYDLAPTEWALSARLVPRQYIETWRASLGPPGGERA